jgi:Ca2+-binding EF-hand superfamily protein
LNTFKTFDKNGNGTISREEMYEGYKEIYGSKLTNEEIIKEVD